MPITFLTLLQLASAATLYAAAAHTPPPLAVQTSDEYAVLADVKVPVVLGVMSACPDAIYCEAVFDDVLAQAGDKVDLSLTFIGKYVWQVCQPCYASIHARHWQTERFRTRFRSDLYAWAQRVCWKRAGVVCN